MMDSRVETVKALMEEPAFVESIAKMEDNTEVQKAFADRGVDFTLAEIDAIAEMVYSGAGVLSEEELENVSGGVLAEIAIVASGVALFANVMTEVNNNRKANGKKPIW